MNKMIFLLTLLLTPFIWSQSYAPAAGEPGTTAIHFEDPAFNSWAATIDVQRGYINIEDTTATANGSSRASFGDPGLATGPATGNTADVVSLGDKGVATMSFDRPIKNGSGFDFAVFENSFSDNYLELAHVEVSSDGDRFVRFPSHSEVQDDVQIHGFGTTDPEMIHNLAGKYRAGYGTPFDLEEIKDSTAVDVNNISHIRIIDVVGSVGDSASYDSYGNKINDPFSTPYESGGFDLEAVGIIHQVADIQEESEHPFTIFPNPSKGQFQIRGPLGQMKELLITSSEGKIVQKIALNSHQKNISISLPQGVYFVYFSDRNASHSRKIIVQ